MRARGPGRQAGVRGRPTPAFGPVDPCGGRALQRCFQRNTKAMEDGWGGRTNYFRLGRLQAGFE